MQNREKKFTIVLYIVGIRVPEFQWIVDGKITPLFNTVSLTLTTAITLTVLYKMCKPFNLFKFIIFTTVFIIVVSVFYFGLYQQESLISEVINGFLKFTWPYGEETKALQLNNTLMLFLMILLINPVMGIMENVLGTIKKVKI